MAKMQSGMKQVTPSDSEKQILTFDLHTTALKLNTQQSCTVQRTVQLVQYNSNNRLTDLSCLQWNL